MYNLSYTEEFNLSVTLLVDIFQLRNKAIAESYRKTFTGLFSPEYTTDMILAAIFRLATTDPDTCQWILRNLSTLDACISLVEGTRNFVIQKLIGLDYVLGKHFSISYNGKVLISQDVESALLANVLATDKVFVVEALQVID